MKTCSARIKKCVICSTVYFYIFPLFRSCILASREHTCIADINIYYPQISYKSKTELCRDLLDPRAVSALIRRIELYIIFRWYNNITASIILLCNSAIQNKCIIVKIETKPEPVIVTGLTKHLCRYIESFLAIVTTYTPVGGLNNTFIDNWNVQ